MFSEKKFSRAGIYFGYLFIALIALLIQGSLVSAMNIGYSVKDIDFQPNTVVEIEYVAINTLNEELDAVIILTGDLTEYMKAEPERFRLAPYASRAFKVRINFPEKIEKPGSHRQVVMVKEEKLEKHAGINVFAAPGVPLFIHVPYEGKYLDAVLEAADAKLNEPVYFTIRVNNLGSETINMANGIISVYDKNEVIIGVINTNTITNLEEGASSSLSAEMQTFGLTAGAYSAGARINYDEFSKDTERTSFRIGELKIDILNHTSEAYSGKINKFLVTVESRWNEPVENVYADIVIKKDDSKLASFKTIVETVGAWERKDIEGYLDSTNMQPGTYEAEITLNYAGKTELKTGRIEVKGEVARTAGEEKGTSAVTVVVMIIIIFLNLLIWLLVLRKKKRR